MLHLNGMWLWKTEGGGEIMEKKEEVQQKNTKKLRVPVEVYSRVVGYFRPVQNWNPGKQQEFKERKYYNLGNPPEQSR